MDGTDSAMRKPLWCLVDTSACLDCFGAGLGDLLLGLLHKLLIFLLNNLVVSLFSDKLNVCGA